MTMHLKSARSLWPSARRSHLTRAALAFAAVLSGNAWADGYLDAIGGPGGGQFQARCEPAELLAGFELRAGDDVDAIRPLCITAYGPRDTSAVRFTVGTGLIVHIVDANREVWGHYSEAGGDWMEFENGWHGGMGGGLTHVVCPADHPIVTGMFVGSEGVDTVIVNNVHLFCGLAAAPSQTGSLPSAVFDAPAYAASKAFLGIGGGGDQPYRGNNTQHCPDNLVAVGVHGRSGVWLDAIGLICGEPRVSEHVKSIGRVDTGTSPAPHPPGWTICDAARAARARNSPAAPNLEAQCQASKGPVKSIGRVNPGAPPPHPPGWTICDAARAARARNSPAAPNLEAQCRALPPPPPPPPPPPADDPQPDPVPDGGE